MQENNIVHPGNEIYPLDLLIVLVRCKKLVIGLPILMATLGLIVSFLMTPIFTSTVKIMPPQQSQSSGVAAMLGQLGGLAGAAGSIAGIKSPNDLYVGILQSRTIADNLIQRFKLKERYSQKTMDATRQTLENASDIVNGKKDGLISVNIDDKDPEFAASLANAYVEELTKLTQSMALTEAAQRRLFFEKQMKDAKNQLADAEVALRMTQEKTGMILPDGQVQAIITNVAQLKAVIAAKEVQLVAMRTFAAGKNPELLRTQEELRGLQSQLTKLEKNQPSADGDLMVPTGNIPAVGVLYVRRLREVKYYETIFELLAKQFELAKIDEAKDSSMIQVLDKAIPAERKSKPKRASFVIAGGFGGVLLGIFFAFSRASYIGSRKNIASNQRWQILFSAWRGGDKKLESDL